jgi:hypothetical protein
MPNPAINAVDGCPRCNQNSPDTTLLTANDVTTIDGGSV